MSGLRLRMARERREDERRREIGDLFDDCHEFMHEFVCTAIVGLPHLFRDCILCPPIRL